MTDKRVPYDEAASTHDMACDCAEVEHNLHLPHHRLEHPAGAHAHHFDRVDVSDDLAERAAGLELHID